MPKEQSNFAHNYKRNTAAGVDTRVLRAHRRSIEWKQSRDEVVFRRRNVEAMSPVVEAKSTEQNIKETRKTTSSDDDKVANRKAQLMKWKEQKDLRKKTEELEKAKKKPFRVVHVEAEVVAFKKSAIQLPKVAAGSGTSAKVPSTRSKTVGAEARHDVAAPRHTRSRIGSAAVSSGSVMNTRETRSKSSSVAPQTAGKAQKKAHEPKIPDKSKLLTKVSNTKPSTGVGKKELKAAAVSERATRAGTRAAVVAAAKPVAPSRIQSSSASSPELPKVFDFSYSRMRKVNLKRGSELSFAPADFRFTAPENVKSFSFNKLNASKETHSAEKMTTETSVDGAVFSSGGSSAAKRQTRRLTKMTSTPRVPEIEKERLRTPPISAVASEVLAIVPASDCVVLVEKLSEPIAHVGPVLNMMESAEKRPGRKSQSRSSVLPVGENQKKDRRSRSNLRRTEDRTDDSQRDDTSPDEPRRSRRSLRSLGRRVDSQRDDTPPEEPARSRALRKRKSKEGVARRSVHGKLPDGYAMKKSLEEMGAGDAPSKDTPARNRKSIEFQKVKERSKESGIQRAFQCEDLRALDTPEKKPETGAVVKESGQRGRRSVLPKNDVAMTTEGSRRRSAVTLMSSMPISDSDVEPAQKTAKEIVDNDFTVVGKGKTPERRVGARRSMRGKLAPGGSTSNNDDTAQTDKIPEENVGPDPVDENEPKKMKASKNSKRKSVRNLASDSSAGDLNTLSVTEVAVETTEAKRKASLEVVTESCSQRAEETENQMVTSKLQNVNTVVFQTPSQPIRSILSRSVALGPDSLKRKTPKNIRNSLILRTLSPEEGVEILKNSPMIELNRRKLKTPPTGSRGGNQMVPIAPMPSFDDIDAGTDLSKVGSAEHPGNVLSSFDAEPTVSNSPALAEPISADEPPVPVKEIVASPTGNEKDGVKRFRQLMSSETDRLKTLCSSWKEMLISDAEQLSEEVSGQIRTTIGQAELLMAQRFKQFSGLVDDCEFKTSEKEVTCTDLQGFWDMIYYQVEDVDKKFCDLHKLKAANWVVEKQTMPVKSKVTRKKVDAATKTTVASKKTATQSDFAQFRQHLQQQKQQGQEAEAKAIATVLVASPSSEIKTFDGGFFKVDSPVQKKTQSSTEKRSSLLEVGNTPKATSVARVVLQRMIRKSLVQSMQDCELNPTTPPGATNADLTGPSQSKQSPILPGEGQQLTSIKKNKQNGRARRSTRKSVYFSDVTDCDTMASGFSKYLMPSSDSVISTPDVPCELADNSLLASTKTETTLQADVEVDELPAKGFKGLKLGFTPGVDGKSRRISSFTPLPNVEKTNRMSRGIAKSEPDADLMTFSPFTSTAASNESSGENGKKEQGQRRRSTRRSMAKKARISSHESM